MTYVIGTAGHVDHGKSTLIHALTGIDPDRLREEKEREMTIDLGFAWLPLPGGEVVGVVDVPGHRDFIENMLAGVGGIDLALIVIAADEGVMPQTREHLAILDLLEIPEGVIALTKTDLIEDDEWLDLVTLEVAEVLEGTALENAPIVPVSAQTGAGLDRLIAVLGETLSGQSPRPDRGRPRLAVDRVFTMSGFGTVVTGTLINGSLAANDEVEIVPTGKTARIRGLQSHKESITAATPGSRVAINLSGVDKTEIQRGHVIALPGTLTGTTLVDVQFRHLADAGRPLKHNAEVKVFSGSAETMAYVRVLGERELAPGKTGWLQLRLSEPMALDRQDRFILRHPSPPQTIGGGVVLDPHPPHRWRRYKPEVLERLEALASGTPDELIRQALEGQIALRPEELTQITGVTGGELTSGIQVLEERDEILFLPGDWLMARSSWERLAGYVSRELSEFHRRYPLQTGMPREQLRSRLNVSSKLFNQLTGLLLGSEIVAEGGSMLRLPEHEVRFSALQQAATARLMEQIGQDPVNTPSVKDAVELVGEDVLRALIEQGKLVQVSADVLFDAETYDQLLRQVRAYIEDHGAITVGQARDLFGTSRKYVLALLEHMDAAGITIRQDNQRVLRA